MNKKVLKVMITLTVAFLLGYYVLKIFFPEQFVMAITNEHIVAFGKFVDERLWLHMILGTITSFITYWLYLCAVGRSTKIGWKLCLFVLGICIATQFVYYFVDVNLGSLIGILTMVVLPAFKNAQAKDIAMVFGVHYTSQFLATRIRNLPLLLPSVNYATILLLGLECYFWLLLFYFYNNYRRK